MTPPAGAALAPARRPRTTTRRVPVRHPRRISGPARPVMSAAAVALPAPKVTLPARRVAPPKARVSLPTPRVAPGAVLDKLMRGRAWIAVLACALIGLVAIQVVVLKLNTGIGRALQREALLERQDAQLGVEDSLSSAGDRVEPLAAASGMTIAAPAALHFVAITPYDISKAAAALTATVQLPVTEGVQPGPQG